MRLYRLVVRLLALLSELYFVEIRAVGREQVPVRGPVILAANHPSSILDSILLATQLQRPIHYLARSGLFRFKPLAALFRLLGAVPIYRASEVDDADSRNLEVFEKVFELFESGGCVGIFPEGRNSPKDRIAPLRKGAARLALGAEARNEGRLGLVVVPVGVNFENRGFLMSAVLLRFGEPIPVADYLDGYRDNAAATLGQLTDDIQRGLSKQVLTIENARLGQLVDDLAAVFGDQLDRRFDGADPHPDPGQPPRQRLLMRLMWRMAAWYRRATPETSRAFERRMISRQQIRDALVRAWQHSPREVVALRTRLERYKDHLRQTELRGALSHGLDEPVRQRLIRLRMTLYSVLMAPVALFGLLHNILPYLLAKALGRLGGADEAVRAFSLFGFGVLVFGAWYTGLGLWLWQFTRLGAAETLIYLALLPPTGFAALRYRRNVLIYRDSILVRTFFFNQRELVELLREQRRLIFEAFVALAQTGAEASESDRAP